MHASTTQPPQLRPLGIGEILDAGFKVYRSHFKTLALCVLVPTVPLAILQLLLLLSIDSSAFDPNATPEEVSSGLDGAALAGFAVAVLLGGLATYASAAACIRAVAAAYLDDEVTWQDSLKFGLRRMLPVLGLSFLIGLLTLIGLAVLIIPGVFLFIRWGVTIPARLVEDAKWFSSIGRSWELVGGRWWATFALYLILFVMLIVISIVFGAILALPAAGFDSTLAGVIANILSGIVTNVIVYPLAAAVITILYFDLRVRKEGLDLALLAERMGSETSPASVADSSGLGDYRDASPSPSPSPGDQSYGGFSAPRAPDEPGPDPRA